MKDVFKIKCCTSLIIMQLLAVVFAALATSQTLAFPTNGNEDEIFSEDAYVHPSNAPPGEQKIGCLQKMNLNI